MNRANIIDELLNYFNTSNDVSNLYFYTFPLDLIPFARQAKTMSQDNSKHKARSHLISPISPNV